MLSTFNQDLVRIYMVYSIWHIYVSIIIGTILT